MRKPILYYLNLSPPVRACVLTAKAIGLDLELKNINILSGEHLSEEFVKINPQHTIPTLDDNGVIVWDSHAIVTYLVAKYGKDDSLYPKALVTRAKVDQRLHFDNGVLFTRMRYFLEPIIFHKSTDVSEEKLKKMDEAYDFLEAFLKTDLYMVGNTLTVADFCCIATAATLHQIRPMNKKKHSKVFAWMERLAKLPYYYEANQKGAEVLGQLFRETLAVNKVNVQK